MELVARSLLSISRGNITKDRGGPIPTDEHGFSLPLTPQTSDAESDIDLDHSSNDGSVKVPILPVTCVKGLHIGKS